MNYRSESIDLITTAFAKAQGSYKPLVSNQATPGGRFANLQAILESVKEALSSNGLVFYQFIELLDEGSGASLLRTVLSHSSGQWLGTSARVKTGNTFKETFNCIEAYRRLNALLLLGIAPSELDPLIRDDNGTEEMDKAILKNIRNPEVKPKEQMPEMITADNYEQLMYELEGYEEVLKGIQTTYGITSLADLPKSEYYKALGKIREIKKRHEDYVRNKT